MSMKLFWSWAEKVVMWVLKAVVAWCKKKANTLFGMGESLELKIARTSRTIGILIAIVIAAFGITEILDVVHMREIFGLPKMGRLIAGDIMLYALENYLVWSLLVLAVAMVVFYIMRTRDRQVKASA